jgi:rSAM/selenodomain-associated transferase 2/rSAM/selenodomain-associated transferase 1
VSRARPSLTIVIPTLDEAERLPRLLSDLDSLDAEVVVVDGGSADATRDLARAGGARVLESPPGRATQLRTGAASTDAEWLFFLHADSRIEPDALTALRDFLASAALDDFAHYRFALDDTGRFHRFIEFGQRLRERWSQLPYGDQGLIVSRELYERAGCYPQWPIMEDVGLLDRLAQIGRRVVLPARLLTSSRRYDAESGVLAWLRNATLMTLFHLGVPPSKLARWYVPQRPDHRVTDHRPVRPSAERRTVVVFAKAPTPGRVKTRLAAEVGTKEAVRIYRSLGRGTVDALRGGPHRLVVYVDPPGPATAAAMHEWLGREGLEYRPQSEGELGVRMARAFDECLDEADSVCIVGTDIPGIDRDTVHRAFDTLREADVVFGPATDGGYYLVAMRRRHPDLFAAIAWSTATVLATTLARASEAGLRVALLEVRTDVDTLADVPEELLAG